MLNKGDKVYLAYQPELTGIVVEPGEQQSGVKFSDGMSRYIINRHLLGLEQPPSQQTAAKVTAPKERIDYKSVRIKVLVEGNPRSPTAKAHRKWEEMKAYIAANPDASVAEVAKETSYKTGDFSWDRERGNVTTEAL